MTESNESGPSNEGLERVANELVGQLGRLGFTMSGTEQPEELLDLVEAVGRFEDAVEARGGDLMVDEGPGGKTTEPDDPHFALPVRGEDESVAQYLERLERATEAVRRHGRRAD